jgi:hypothetical protein
VDEEVVEKIVRRPLAEDFDAGVELAYALLRESGIERSKAPSGEETHRGGR